MSNRRWHNTRRARDLPESAGSLRDWRRIPRLAIAGVLALLVAGLLVAGYGEYLYREQRVRDAAVQAQMLAASVAEPLEYEDRAAIRDNVNALRANPAIEAAAVFDVTGDQVAGYRMQDVALPPLARQTVTRVADDRILMNVPVVQEDRPVGTVVLSAKIEPVARRLTRYGGIALLAIMGSLVVIVLSVAHGAMRRVNAALEASNRQLKAEAAERAHAEEALRQAQKMQALGQLTGGIAHDFNNLLTPITGSLEYIASATEDPLTKRMAINALEAARRGAKLTGQLLAFSRVQQLSVAPVPVNEVIMGMRALLEQSIGKTVAVTLDLAEDAGHALCDANQIENAILNLAINARDAMEGGGRLTIATRCLTLAGCADLAAGDYVELAVADTGTGMPPEVLARATEPFFTTKEVGKGTGLGLAQVYAIAQQYGGTLRIDTRLGEGTTARILLPRTAGDQVQDAPQGKAGDTVRCSTGAELLIVDDDEEVRQFMSFALDRLGYRTRAVANAEEGLRVIEAALPDLLLVDYAMPGLNGADMARAVRERHPELPIVFVTGYAETAALEAALGPDAPVLRKPFGHDELLAAVEQHLASAQDRVSMS